MAQIPKVQFTLPGVSIFDVDTTRIGTMPIGKIIPMDWTIMTPGDTQRCTLAELMRMAPLATPAFAGFEVTFDSFFVPFRLINKEAYEYFSYGKNPDGVDFEAIDYKILLRKINSSENPIGSLLDYLRYPVYAQFFNALFDRNAVYHVKSNSSASFEGNFDWDTWAFYWNNSPGQPFDGPLRFRNVVINGLEYSFDFQTLSTYAAAITIGRTSFSGGYSDFLSEFESLEDWFASAYFKELGFTTSAFIERYQSSLFLYFLISNLDNFGSKELSVSPIKSYWRVIADWFLNTNIVDPEQLIDTHVFGVDSSSANPDIPQDWFVPADYWWRNDYFTSMLPTAAGEYQVPLPSNGTVQDLAEATALQRFLNRIWAAGKRYYDNVRAIYGWESKDARDQYSKIIGSDTHYLGVSEVTQTSSSDTTSSLGDLAGKVVDRGYDKYHYNYTADEHGILLTVAYVSSRVGYMDAYAPLLNVVNTLDYIIPDMADVGFVPYYTDVLTGNLEDADTVLGYQRQYYPWISDFDTVHGEMKTTLQYWHLYRRFMVNEIPALNTDFLTMNDTDDFGRIFAVPEERAKVLYMVNFYKEVERPLSRSIKMII